MKFISKPIPEHEEVPLADEGRWEEIVGHSLRREGRTGSPKDASGNACYVLSVGAARDPLVREAQLAEIRALVLAQGDRIVGEEIYHLSVAIPRTVIGKGAARDIAARARACGADLLVLDAELSPSQMRNLEDDAGISVCDREAVILNVFLRHAKTQRARIQVAVAQLEYLRPRICGVGINMDQQAGGIGGGRGPGETASELVARKLDGRLAEMKKVLKRLDRSGATQRRLRGTSRRVVLVGYTNAGKTSLMNALAHEALSVRDRPFETLDATARCISRHGGDVLLSDTVGFIRRLPERLMASFESTLAEIREASLLLIVVDSGDHERREHLQTTVGMLEKLGAKNVPRLYVFNKIDRLPDAPAPELLAELSDGHPFVALSSRDEEAVDRLREELLRRVRRDQEGATVFVPYSSTHAMSMVYAKCRVIKTEPTSDGLRLQIQGDPVVIAKIKRSIVEARS